MVSDKIEHGLWGLYHECLPLDDVNVLVEIGVYQGDGMRLFQEYYPKARIIGIDLLPRPEGLEDHFEYHQMAQESPSVADVCADADIVVDDCGHNPVHTQQTFDLVWPRLKVGSVYFIEDWTTMPHVIDGIEARGIETERFIVGGVNAIAKFTKTS